MTISKQSVTALRLCLSLMRMASFKPFTVLHAMPWPILKLCWQSGSGG